MKFSNDGNRGPQEKVVKTILIVIVILSGVVGGGLKFLKEKGAPKYKGKVELKGLKDEVSVSFDQYGIPHVKAVYEEDAFKTLGYVMAQDRLFQMDLMRRVAKGRLSEVFGEKALETDKVFRTLNLLSPFQAKSFEANREVKTVMAAFYDGVNQFITEGRWPFEYTLLGFEPEPFSPMDGYGVLGYMAYSFAMGLKTDPLMEALFQKVGLNRMNELRREPLPPPTQKTVEARPSSHLKNTLIDHGRTSWFKGHEFLAERIGLFSGSNAWAMAPSRTRKGQSILASDPHVSFSVPGLWYEAYVTWDKGLLRSPFEFYGHFVPNLPFPAMAHTLSHAWAVTISYLDDMDFIWKKTANGEVLEGTSWKPLKKRTEVIKVKGKEDIQLIVEETSIGPLIGSLLGKFGIKKSGYDVAIKWGHLEKDNRPGKAFYGALMAKDKRAFEDALSFGRSPGVNVIYADQNGNIARYLYGTQYKRYYNDSGDRFKEFDSEAMDNLYKVIPFEERNHLINPESGIVVSANQKPENSPQLKSGYFQPMDRYQTIHEILAGQSKWSLEELQVVQTAPVNIFFPTYVKAISDALVSATLNEKEDLLLRQLKKWEGRSPASSAEALIFYTFFNNLQLELLRDLSQEEIHLYCQTNYSWHFISRSLQSGEKNKEILKAFRDTVKLLEKKHGPSANWFLGAEQTLTLSHPLSRGGPHLAFFLDIGPHAMDGGFNQINNMRPVGCKDGLVIKAGPSTRRLVSFDNPRESFGILPLGNSGHYASPFFSDQWPLFREGGYRKQIMRDLEEEETFSTLSFMPLN